MIYRYSSRREQLQETFLNQKLLHAVAYDRIAGYFSSSLLEVAAEAIGSISGRIRIVCNSELDERDVATARAAAQAIRQEWCGAVEARFGENGQPRFQKLYEYLKSGKMEVRVLPSQVYGLIHGKAGVITFQNGGKTSFMGSANESLHAWRLNYELVWEDDSPESVAWIQEEFDQLWHHPSAVRLSDFVVDDIGRTARRRVLPFDEWIQKGEASGAVVESPVYRRELGLWAHQKYFVQKAFNDHLSGKGARYILADMVGLGKTVQLALAAQLMALHSDHPVLIIAPRTLIWQWQDEMLNLLDMPSAVWNGRQWVDEAGISYPVAGLQAIKKCPRRVGIVSQGLITRQGEVVQHLLQQTYECVIVDECHRARRKNLKKEGENEPADPNNLMRFLLQLAVKTKSLLMATATPVQLYPIEAYDLLDILSRGNDHVLGNEWSLWRQMGNRKRILDLVSGRESPPGRFEDIWEWIRNPLPAPDEDDRLFGVLRGRMGMHDSDPVLEGSRIQELNKIDRNRIERSSESFFRQHNPFIRHIIRRTRDFLENTIDPQTNEPYLQPVKVELFGEDKEDAVPLPGYLDDAYKTAEEFCEALGERMRSAGFLRTLLLRRMGSSIEAGKSTAIKILEGWQQEIADEEEEEDTQYSLPEDESALSYDQAYGLSRGLTAKEQELLEKLIRQLEKHQDKDPKFFKLREYLFSRNWLELGCIIFSQYYDTVWYMANLLSAEMATEPIGIYAGSNKSGVLTGGRFLRTSKEEIKSKVRKGELRVLFGTDAASEGLNLQRLGSLINLDLPWNPTRLEQRKGRIQRIGQIRDTVKILNMRYRGSVEDRVHELLSDRLEHIHHLFGQIPDVLEDVWVEVAIGSKQKAREIIDAVPQQHPFEMKYNRIEQVDFEHCTEVLNNIDRREALMSGC